MDSVDDMSARKYGNSVETVTQTKLSTTSSCISIIGATNEERARNYKDDDDVGSFACGSLEERRSLKLLEQATSAAQVQPSKQQQASGQNSGPSRFFSSKLNTGSLWSLLSASGANSSTTTINDMSHQLQAPAAESVEKQDEEENCGSPRAQLESSRSTSSFFSRQFQFPATYKNKITGIGAQALQSVAPDKQQQQHPAKSAQDGNEGLQQQQQHSKRRNRFNVKYIGNTLLHKNFTLPMLEWIVKDVKRQTIRGAQSINQRQFTIPARDIIFEIQTNQITAISCKDGHCIFVHPMHCVSKYAQLQHDPTCFAYIIRDSKDAPSFCHVFQAKSTTKIHEIFNTIRETTTIRASNASAGPQAHWANEPTMSSVFPQGSSSFSSAARGLQKSASTEGHWRSLLSSSGKFDLQPRVPNSAQVEPANLVQQPLQPHSSKIEGGPGYSGENIDGLVSSGVATHAEKTAANLQFENSYQFEVMFVKRVKLQCRRVPPTFVDDALETLRSFETPKAQIKGVTKRIISASVDERQEYDEQEAEGNPSAGQAIAGQSKSAAQEDTGRRGSLVSLNPATYGETRVQLDNSRESKSCQQSPAKQQPLGSDTNKSLVAHHEQLKSASCKGDEESSRNGDSVSKNQSVEYLSNHDCNTIRELNDDEAPAYGNDFSPYNTITSSDLNERIAAIPVVSGSSVSLDHETRQRLAKKVRETIMATAANIKKGAYASGENLDLSSSCKALDSLSCSVAIGPSSGSASSINPTQQLEAEQNRIEPRSDTGQPAAAGHSELSNPVSTSESRRSSASTTNQSSSTGNNFDLFRRASARSQIIKNRTMLLLIGKDELCAISIDKHQMLFSKSFNSIVHCLQGMSNRDHFGLICRDSGKINPQAESYAGFVFKCQSEKVVREIMGALKQVIYNSQHNYHAHDSPYNPLNSFTSQTSSSKVVQESPKLEQRVGRAQTRSCSQNVDPQTSVASGVSLASKRGFTANLPGLEDAAQSSISSLSSTDRSSNVGVSHPTTAPVSSSQPLLQPSNAATALAGHFQKNQQPPLTAPKSNPIKSMFCDNCPLYWYHRLCCDIESLPAEASKTIILRRIDSSLNEREQDDVFTRFSEFKIESIEQHNEIFMSILRHQCERKQLKHSQSHEHQTAMAKQLAASTSAHQQKQQQQHQQQRRAISMQREATLEFNESARLSASIPTSQRTSAITAALVASPQSASVSSSSSTEVQQQQLARGHQRSGSSSGSLSLGMGPHYTASSGSNGQSLAEASSAAIGNLKRAKNSISVSIDNILKRRSSTKDDQDEERQSQLSSGRATIVRAGSFKGPSSTAASASYRRPTGTCLESAQQRDASDAFDGGLKRSQSSTDYNPTTHQGSWSGANVLNWRDSILSRTFNATDVDLATPLVGFFYRRGSFARNDPTNASDHQDPNRFDSKRASTESLTIMDGCHSTSGQLSPMRPHQKTSGTSSPSQLLSGSFWKKNIFDKIHHQPFASSTKQTDRAPPKRRTSAELRLLWQKAIREQITLLKMDKKNQELQQKGIHNEDGRQTKAKTEQGEPPTVICPCDDPIEDQQASSLERIKLNYRDVSHTREAQYQWDKFLKEDPTKKVEFVQVVRLVRSGVPKRLRGEVWMFLMNQYQLRHGTSFQPADSEYKGDADQTYRSLLSQLSTQQHEIFVDIGK